jgi:hypothetical protein
MDIVSRTLEWMNKTWINKACPYCGGNKFSIAPKIYEVEEFTKVSLPDKRDVIPCVIVICKTCGAVTQISSSKIGIE